MPERDQMAAGPRRFIDALCAYHRDETLTNGWPFPGDFHTVAACCDACAAATDALIDDSGRLWLRSLADLTTGDVERHAAIHEAAHAVVGIRTGRTLHTIRIAADGGGNGLSEPAGQVTWGPPRKLPIIDHLAMAWAGEAAGLRWLTQHGHDTNANRLDIGYLACGDVAEAAKWATKFDIPVTTGRAEAAQLVAQHWPAITTLADELVTRREMCGADVHDLVTQRQHTADNTDDDTDGDG